MNELKRMSYKKIIEKLNGLGFIDQYDITKGETDLEGFTSGLQAFNYTSGEDFTIMLRKYKRVNMYIVEVDTDSDCLAQYIKDYFEQYNNIDYVMINGG